MSKQYVNNYSSSEVETLHVVIAALADPGIGDQAAAPPFTKSRGLVVAVRTIF